VTRETRLLPDSALEVRTAEGKAPAIRGYGARFNVLSENLGGFREQIKPGAFAGVLADDVRALINHDPNFVLGRTTAGTLKIGEDERGLWYEVDLPDTSAARDLVQSIKRGDVTQSSFAFRIAADGDSWDEDAETGAIIRTVTKMGRLYDVSAVTYPAYPDASVGMRSLEDFKKRKTDEQKERDRQAYERRKVADRERALREQRLKDLRRT
jgi:hypothetical protein